MWIIYALSASVIWGANYVIYERLLKHISYTSLYIIDAFFTIIVWALLAYYSGSFSKDLSTVQHAKNIQLLIAVNILTAILANIFIALSIQAKKATLSGMIEISYPLFIILLGWLFFRESHLNLSVLIGGCFIFSGVFIIYFFNR